MTVKRIQLVAQIVGFVTIGVLAILGALTVVSGGRPAWAALGQPPSTMSTRVDNVIAYQGMLRGSDGGVNGTYTMTFKLYDSADASIALHAQTVPGVSVRDGLFTVLLGDPDPLDGSFFQDPVYVGVQVEGDAEMQPRQRMHPVPYAIQLTDGVYVDGLGNVGIGTESPQAQLDVSGDVLVQGHPPVLIKRYENVGDSVLVDTGIPAADYECVATGWSAFYDIREAGADTNMVWTYVEGLNWHLRVQFNSHNDHETPDVDVLCFRREIASWQGAARTLNHPD